MEQYDVRIPDDYNEYTYTQSMVRVPHYYDFTDKVRAVRNYVYQMLSRTQEIFDYEGLPETMPKMYLERYLQRNGVVGIAIVDDRPYIFLGGIGGDIDPYYFPTKFITANPALEIAKEFTIGKDCAIIRNDSEMQGLMPMCNKYASLLVENDITMRMVDILSRVPVTAITHTSNEVDSVNLMVKAIEDGRLSLATKESLGGINSLRTEPMTAGVHDRITEYIEFHQYVKAQWYNDLGVRAQYNMKRESLSEHEISANDDTLIPFVDDMLHFREKGLKDVKELFGLDIKVKYSSVWEKMMKQTDLSIEMIEAEIDATKQGGEEDDGQVLSDEASDGKDNDEDSERESNVDKKRD